MFHFGEFKSFYNANILLCVIILFSVVYCIYNWNNVLNFSLYNSNSIVTKPVLVSAIIFLIFHMLITWDDNIDTKTNLEQKQTSVQTPVQVPVPDGNSDKNIVGGNNGFGGNNDGFSISKPFGTKYRFSLGGNAHKGKIIGSGIDAELGTGSKKTYKLTNGKTSQTSSIFIPQSKTNNYGLNF